MHPWPKVPPVLLLALASAKMMSDLHAMNELSMSCSCLQFPPPYNNYISWLCILAFMPKVRESTYSWPRTYQLFLHHLLLRARGGLTHFVLCDHYAFI